MASRVSKSLKALKSGYKRALKSKPKTTVALSALGGGAGLAGLMALLRTPNVERPIALEQAVRDAERRAKNEKLAQLLQQSSNEQAIMENEARLARSLPDLYTSIMAGRSVPAGSIVLGGRPRKDLLRELAASMGSGRFDRPDPLSELIG